MRPDREPSSFPPPRTPFAGTAALLRRTADLAAGFLATLDERPVRASATRAELLAGLGGPLPETGEDPTTVLEHLAREAEPGVVGMAGPRYFGFVIGGSLPAALAADWLTSTWDQNAGIYVAGPSASVVEEVVGEWLIDLFGLPEGSGFGLTTGCQMAHVTCLAAARHRVLADRGWDVEAHGLAGGPVIDVVAGAEAHATIATALQYLGLGRDRVTAVETDGQGRLRLEALEMSLPAGDRPLIVCLQAGNVNTGAFDDFGPAIELVRARRPDAWIHVDGAFGLWAAAAPRLRHLVAGVERADSWATDGHKWLNVPYDCGFAFVRDVDAHLAALSPQGGRLHRVRRCGARRVPVGAGVLAPCPRVRLWAALRSLGREGVATLVERQLRHGGSHGGRAARGGRGRRRRGPQRRGPQPGPGAGSPRARRPVRGRAAPAT